MDSEFDNWNIRKKKLNASRRAVHFHEREVWFCAIGKNIGFEQNGKHAIFERPVLIIRKFNQYIFLGVPVTSSAKKNRYHYSVVHRNKPYTMLLSQVRLFDQRRLRRKITTLSVVDCNRVKDKIKKLL